MNKMDELDLVIEEYAGTPLCEMVSHKQARYLGAIAKRGASDALKAIGLNDPQAAADIRDIRDLLWGCRLMKKAAWTTALTGFGRVLGWAVLLTIAAVFINGKDLKQLIELIGRTP